MPKIATKERAYQLAMTGDRLHRAHGRGATGGPGVAGGCTLTSPTHTRESRVPSWGVPIR